tara:strand:- start:179 stop:1468 length:1290 start_codon:yes stop_codon:yes gene_type:complete
LSSSLNIGIAGLGTVGSGVVDLLANNTDHINKRTGKFLKLTAISAKDKSKKRNMNINNFDWFDNPCDLAASKDIDVFVELIGGSDGIAKESVEIALKSGKHVVTANKALIANHGFELSKIAESNSIMLNFEASVAGGIPIIKLLKESLAANKINKIYGILNGTCNFILTQMEKTGKPFDEVLIEAQKLGYAESDPSFDIDGTDTAHKLAVLTALMMGNPPDFSSIQVEGIESISSEDITYSEKLGFCIKLLGIVLKKGGKFIQRVHPCMIPVTSSISRIDDVKNAIFVEGNFIGPLVLEGLGAGAGPTASAVVSDLIDISNGNFIPPFGCKLESENHTEKLDTDRFGPWYIRLEVIDQPGVLAEIAAELKNQSVSIESVLQRGRAPGECVSLIITTHETNEKKFKIAMEKIKKLNALTEPPCMIRIENF